MLIVVFLRLKKWPQYVTVDFQFVAFCLWISRNITWTLVKKSWSKLYNLRSYYFVFFFFNITNPYFSDHLFIICSDNKLFVRTVYKLLLVLLIFTWHLTSQRKIFVQEISNCQILKLRPAQIEISCPSLPFSTNFALMFPDPLAFLFFNLLTNYFLSYDLISNLCPIFIDCGCSSFRSIFVK